MNHVARTFSGASSIRSDYSAASVSSSASSPSSSHLPSLHRTPSSAHPTSPVTPSAVPNLASHGRRSSRSSSSRNSLSGAWAAIQTTLTSGSCSSSESYRHSPPPEYGADYTVEPHTLRNKIPQMMKFSLSGGAHTKVYENGEVIIGTLLVAPNRDVKVSALTVLLEMEEDTSHATWAREKHLNRRVRLKSHRITNLPQDGIVRKNMLYSIPFSIEIPEFLDPSACLDVTKADLAVSDYHTRLPPTLGMPPEYSVPALDIPGNVARITYTLTATLKSITSNTNLSYVVSSIGRHLTIIPSYAVSPEALIPPAQPFKSFLEITKRTGKLPSARTPVGVAQLAFEHYPVLALSSDRVTMLPLSLKFYPSSLVPAGESSELTNITINAATTAAPTPAAAAAINNNHPTCPNSSHLSTTSPIQGYPPPVRKISVYLKARTVYSNDASFKYLPSNLDLIRPVQIEPVASEVLNPAHGIGANAHIGARTHLFPQGFKELVQPLLVTQLSQSCGFRWPEAPSVLSGGKGGMSSSSQGKSSRKLVYSADFAIPLITSAAMEKALIPTYHSCYTMRDYTLVVCVEFPGSNVLTIEVPAVLVKNPTDMFPNYTPGYSAIPEAEENLGDDKKTTRKKKIKSVAKVMVEQKKSVRVMGSSSITSLAPVSPSSTTTPGSASAAAPPYSLKSLNGPGSSSWSSSQKAFASLEDDVMIVDAFERKRAHKLITPGNFFP